MRERLGYRVEERVGERERGGDGGWERVDDRVE